MSNLAPCPDCRAMVSLRAAACPRCGRVFQAEDLKPVEAQPVAQPMSFGWFVMLCLLVLVFVYMIGESMKQQDAVERWRQRYYKTEGFQR